ncbi:antitoxin [Acidocella aquatica]|uniref:Antitoxin n=1 Tax=Acidocella aquatica TaxID=1922313 RepID=A0ABQ6AFR5_9PROT|nr:type II toxin-antitoxin system prevent-host-death family antitoxin [Acidocella aquatica]GLR68954.1 antitoxin [Acidocella aquatica]
MHKISKSQFKPRALELFREVEATGRPLIITDNGTPTLEIRPYAAPRANPLEALRGSVLFFTPPEEME